MLFICNVWVDIAFRLFTMESLLGMSTKNKMLTSSTGHPKYKPQACPVKFKPESLEFENVEINQKYQMQIVIRNEGKENEKIRYIPPTTPYFSIKSEANPFIIAPGLSCKLTFYFHLKATDDCSNDCYEDSVLIIGNSFKKQIELKATKPNFQLLMPTIYKVGLLKVGKQSKFSIPIENVGKEDVQIGLMQTSSPTVVIENSKIIVKKENKSELLVKVKRSAPGPVDEHVYFPNGQSINLKGICTDENVEVYNKQGQILKAHNFGIVFIGEKISYPFYIANNSSSKIEGVVKVFGKNLLQYSNLKVDLSKMAFVNRGNPKKAIEEQNVVNFKCAQNKFVVEPYSDFQNQLISFKNPTEEQLKLFSKRAFVKDESKNRQSGCNSLVQINEVLYIKVANIEQPIKITLEFSPMMPQIYVSNDKFQFFDCHTKQIVKKSFTVHNCNDRAIKFKLENKGSFYFEGDCNFKPWQQKQIHLCFRPLMVGQFSEHLKIILFDVWAVEIKAYAECTQASGKQNKENFKINVRKNGSLETSKSSRYLSEQRKKRLQCEKITQLKSKLTERTNMGFIKKSADEPIDLAFDAGENPRVTTSKKFDIKSISSGLFFNKQQFNRTTAEKKKNLPTANTRLNVKQIVRFSEELTPYQLSKIEVKSDRLDFGSVFVGSSCQKQLIFINKNNRTILLELDIGTSEAIAQTKGQIKKIEPYGQASFTIKLKPSHLGTLRIPLSYIINKQHIFEIDVIANVTLINLGFSTNQMDFTFAQNDPSLEKLETLIVTNYGTTTTKFVVIEPNNKAFTVVGNKEQEILPNSSTNVVVKYRPLQGSQSGELRVESDKLIVKVIGGAQNIIKCEGTIYQPKYSVKQTEINIGQIFISMPQQNKLTLRNNSKCETAIKIELSPNSLNQIISLDQKVFILNCDQRKQINFTVMSHEVKVVKGHFIISSRGGKTYKVPVLINFCFPLVEVVGSGEVDLGTVHIMTNHFEREITLINQTKTEIKLETKRDEADSMDYIIEFIAAHEKVELTLRDTYLDSEKDDQDCNKVCRKSICIEDKIVTANKIKNPKNISKIITLSPGVETKFKMKFVPKMVKHYELKIPLFMHKATRQIEPIPQKIKCKAVQPLFYVNPYSITFSNVIISENQLTHKKQFEIINPHDRVVDWEISHGNEEINNVFTFEEKHGTLLPKQSKKINFYFHPSKERVYSHKIKLFSNLDPQIEVELQINGNAVSPRISFNKNLLILPIVPIKTQSKGLVQIENYGYEAVSISKAKFAHNIQGIELRFTFQDGKLLSLAKKRLKIEISFKSDIPISFTTALEIYDEHGDKISLPISATADNCILTTYPYLEMNNSVIVYDNTDNMLKLLVSKTFTSKNKQTNISGSSAVTGNFIKKWCNYELNIHIENFPDGFVDSRGQLLYEMVIKMTNGRPIIKKPCFTSEQKISRILQLHSYYSQVIKALQVEGAFLNHIRPEHLLNLNDYLLFMLHKEYIIEEDQFEWISHDAWTILFYQLCKLYVEPTVNDKFMQKFNYKHKADKGFNSALYSESQLYVLGFINQFLGEDKIYSMSDQAKIFEVIQRILEKTFGISLGEELSKLKLNADSLMLHEFLILVSKFLFSQLHEFGLSMYLEPNDLFTMGHKEFLLFFISLMQNLINFQTYSVIQFQSASGEKSEKIIQLENPSKKKKIKYWIKLYGSANFKTNQKQIEIEPQQTKMLKVTYHCKKNANQQAQLILVPVKDEDYFTHAHCLNFMIKNILISKSVIKKTNVRLHIYEVKTVNFQVELPDCSESSEYEAKLIGSQFVDEQEYPNYYLIQPGLRTVKNGKDKCEIKIAALRLGELSFKIIYVSATFQEYIYQFNVNVSMPLVSHSFAIQTMVTEKQQKRAIKIPIQNDLKQQCLRFHREMNKEKEKKKRNEAMTNLKIKSKPRGKYQVEFLQQSIFVLASNTVQLGMRDKNDKGIDNLNKIEISAQFTRPYREYKSLLVVKNLQLHDYRIYALSTSVCIRPKIFNIKLTAKAREVTRFVISSKMTQCTYRLQKNLPELKVQLTESLEFALVFGPEWTMKQDLDLYVQNCQTFEQYIYKIKLQGKLPDPVSTIPILASTLFTTPFQIDLSPLKFTEKEFQSLKLHSQIHRKCKIYLKIQDGNQKIVGMINPQPQQENSSIKLMIAKSEQYYQYVLNIKNVPAIDIGTVRLTEAIGETKRYLLQEINTSAVDFFCDYETESYLTHQFGQTEAVETKGRVSKSTQCFCVVFKPSKEIKCQKIFKFKSNYKQYVARIELNAKKLQSISVPAIITENLDKKSTFVIVTNHFDAEGLYETFLEDDSRFKVENHSFQMKNKDKVQIKINFIPKFVGDNTKTRLILRSKTLPELTYCLEGISKFKCKQVQQELEGYQGVQTTKQLAFTNQFNEKERFRFEIVSQSKDYSFDSDVTHFTRDIEPGESIKFSILNKCLTYKQEGQGTKVSVLRLNNRKIVKEYLLILSVVKNIEGAKYKWQCRARETIFETIKLPNSYALKQIRTDPEIEKYVTFNIDEKNENEAKLKFSPLKPIKSKSINILLITNQIKFRIMCHVKVTTPPVDDTITIRTSEIHETGMAVFKLTNVVREPAQYRAYFEKNLQELEVQPVQGMLEAYGKGGTPIALKFKSEIHNKRVEDRLIVETDCMYWVFRVVGMQQKILKF